MSSPAGMDLRGVPPGGGVANPGLVTRAQEWLSPVNLHLAGVALLLIANVYLLVHLAIAWSGAYRDNADSLDQQRIELKGAQIAALPLRGLDTKIERADVESEKFYDQRIATEYSTVLAELGALATKDDVKLTRVQYSEGAAVAGAAATKQEISAADAGLTEVRMDASLSGDYRPLVQFINGLERDKIFFLIGGVALTGQQTGVVNLRMKLLTYLRQPTAEEQAESSKRKAGTKSGPDAGADAAAGGIAKSSGVRR